MTALSEHSRIQSAGCAAFMFFCTLLATTAFLFRKCFNSSTSPMSLLQLLASFSPSSYVVDWLRRDSSMKLGTVIGELFNGSCFFSSSLNEKCVYLFISILALGGCRAIVNEWPIAIISVLHDSRFRLRGWSPHGAKIDTNVSLWNRDPSHTSTEVDSGDDQSTLPTRNEITSENCFRQSSSDSTCSPLTMCEHWGSEHHTKHAHWPKISLTSARFRRRFVPPAEISFPKKERRPPLRERVEI